jgi:hypothetical protein
MEHQGVWEVVEPSGETYGQDAAVVTMAKAKGRNTKAHLLQSLPDDLLMQVVTKKTGKEV